jgi:hypothetical protein
MTMEIGPSDHEVQLIRYGPIRTKDWESKDSDSWALDDYPLKSICQTCGGVVFTKSFVLPKWFHAKDQSERDLAPPDLRPKPPS